MKNCSSYCGFHRVFSPSNQGFQSPSFNSFASTKHISTNPSSSNHQKILSTHSSYHGFHKKSDSMSSSSRLNSQIEIMNMRLSFELLNHKINQLNSMVLPKDNVFFPNRKSESSYVGVKKDISMRPNRFTYYNPVFSPLSSYASYLENTKKRYEDRENKMDSIDLSKIAGDLAETFDPSGSNSILGLGLKEELKQSNMIDKEEENKKIDSENENDKNVKFLNDLIKSSEEKNKAKDYVIETEVITFEENKENNQEVKEKKKVTFKSLKKPALVNKEERKNNEADKTQEINHITKEEKKEMDYHIKQEEKKEEVKTSVIEEKKDNIESKKDNESSHKEVFSKIRNLFNNEEEDEQNENDEEEHIPTLEEQSNENVDSKESTNKEVIERDLKDNSRKKLDFSEEDKEDTKNSNVPNDNKEEEEEDEEAIFAEIIQKAKELEEINSKKKTLPPSESSLPIETPMKSSQKVKRNVTFSEDKKVFIQFHENDIITKLHIIDSNGKESSLNPIKCDDYLNTLKSPIKLRPIILNYSMSDTPNKAQNNFQTLISESNKEQSSYTETQKKLLSPMKDPKSPMRRNIQLIQTIEDYKRKGLNYPRIKKPRAHTPIPQHHCRKFKENPQKFFTEDLCENVLKAYDLTSKSNNSNLCKSESKT